MAKPENQVVASVLLGTLIYELIRGTLLVLIAALATYLTWNVLLVGPESVIGISLPHLTMMEAFGLQVLVRSFHDSSSKSKS